MTLKHGARELNPAVAGKKWSTQGRMMSPHVVHIFFGEIRYFLRNQKRRPLRSRHPRQKFCQLPRRHPPRFRNLPLRRRGPPRGNILPRQSRGYLHRQRKVNLRRRPVEPERIPVRNLPQQSQCIHTNQRQKVLRQSRIRRPFPSRHQWQPHQNPKRESHDEHQPEPRRPHQ